MFHTIKIPCTLPFLRTTLYNIDTNSDIQSYKEFCYLRTLASHDIDLFEAFSFVLEGRCYIALLDESGVLKYLPRNEIMSYLCHTDIVGDVFICKSKHDENIYWLDDLDVQIFEDLFEHALIPNVPPLWKKVQINSIPDN